MSVRSLITGALLDPLALLYLGSLALVVALLRRSRRTPATVLLGLGWTLGVPLVSAPAFVDPLVAAVESRAPEGGFPDVRAGAACAPGTPIVVLGGGIDLDETDPARWEALKPAALARLATGARLAGADPVAPVVVSGGRLGRVAEADALAGLLERLGIDPGRTVREDASVDAATNATRTRALFGLHPLLPVRPGVRPRVRLVTSALHMRRAAGSFAGAGFDVCAVPVDRTAHPSASAWRVVPDVEALDRAGRLLHEVLGRAFYRLRGHIGGPGDGRTERRVDGPAPR